MRDPMAECCRSSAARCNASIRRKQTAIWLQRRHRLSSRCASIVGAMLGKRGGPMPGVAAPDSCDRHVRLRYAVTCAVLVMALTSPRAEVAPLDMRLHIDASLRTNAVYHLGCLGGSISCSRDIFERFWKERLHESDDDRQTVAAWQQLLASAGERAPDMKPSPLLINALPTHPDALTRRQVIAGLIETRSAATLQRRAPGLTRDEASALIKLVDHVDRRLRPWWRAEGEQSAKARIRGVADTARRNHMMQALGQMARFLESVPPSRDAYVHAIAAPEPESKDYTATAILNHLPIEAVAAAGDPNDIVYGAVHELAHYLYDYIPPEKHLTLVNEFVTSGASSIAGIYSYLHEAMAISAQGIYGDALRNGAFRDDDDGDTGYQHPYIPVLGGVAVPLVKAAIARNEHLVGGFSSSYIADALSKLGNRSNELPFVFAQAIYVTTSGNGEFANAFQRTLFPVAAARFKDLAKAEAFPDTNVVQFSTYAELGVSLQFHLLALRDGRRGFAYASQRGRGGYHLIVAGRSSGDILAVIEKLGDIDALIGPGLVASVD
jgi:hypothetical protein